MPNGILYDFWVQTQKKAFDIMARVKAEKLTSIRPKAGHEIRKQKQVTNLRNHTDS
jgi:hypothetical protein